MPDALDMVLGGGLADTADLACAAGVSRRSAQRWVQRRCSPHPDQKTRLLEIAAVLEAAAAALPGGSDAVPLWLRAPSRDLDWQVPLELIRQGAFRQVIAALNGRPHADPAGPLADRHEIS
jgi:uncharacterized protein (DUF2384 family)